MAEGAPRRPYKYERIAGTLELFATKIYPPGRKLPTEPQLEEIFRASTPTVERAMGLLVQKGIVERQRGKGSFVREQAQTPFEFTPGEVPPDDENKIFYVREMVQRNYTPSLNETHSAFVPFVIQQLQSEGLSEEVVERTTRTISALLSTDASFLLSSILTVTQHIIDDARILRDRGVEGDVLDMAMNHPAAYYLPNKMEEEQQSSTHEIAQEPRHPRRRRRVIQAQGAGLPHASDTADTALEESLPLTKVRRQTLPQWVAATLVTAIENGTRPLGSRLPDEIALAKELGISRNALRNALKILEEEQIITRRRHIGTTINQDVTPENIRELADKLGPIGEKPVDGRSNPMRKEKGITAEIKDRLRDQIICGDLSPDSILTIQGLANELAQQNYISIRTAKQVITELMAEGYFRRVDRLRIIPKIIDSTGQTPQLTIYSKTEE